MLASRLDRVRVWQAVLCALVLATAGCRERAAEPSAAPPPQQRPSILLITLDTTRADSIGPDAAGVETPAFNSVAAKGRRFIHAYATAPETLPSHVSMFTGLYPAAHGIHENARYVPADLPLVTEQLKEAGYRTAAFVSGFPLDRRFGLARGFDHYDDEMEQGRPERSAALTTARAIEFLRRPGAGPLFVWVHYFDPHDPYAPPEPYRSRYDGRPYHGEIAAMDSEMGRLLETYSRRTGGSGAIIVVGDHGESLGEHGEMQHGYLLYQGAMRVPLVIAGPGVTASVDEGPVSIRRIFHTLMDWAGIDAEQSLRATHVEVVVGEAMKPFLSFGWQPQVMAVEGSTKVISAGALEIYDVVADPGEKNDLGVAATLSREMRRTLREYPLPSLKPDPAGTSLGEEERRRLASLGYLTSDTRPVVRKDAPSPRVMTHLFSDLDRASTLFVQADYRRALPLLERILAADPYNLMAALRIAAAHSALGNHGEAMKAFRRAEQIAPDSSDVRHYLALHYLRTGQWQSAAPLVERVVAESPGRLPALEALAEIRERQGRFAEVVELRQRIIAARQPQPHDLIRLGEAAMNIGNTAVAMPAFETARGRMGPDFRHHLELGVLYLEARRLEEAKDALDRVTSLHPGYPMALFKRAQVSVLLGEPDAAARIEVARRNADETTGRLIANERLFR
jgi:choline-sulfatase